jgi:sulfane dehydrogenase subunit SoxC
MTNARNNPPDRPTSRARRRLLGGFAAGSLVVSQRVSAANQLLKPLEVAPWSRTPGAPILEHPYGLPSPHEANVVRRSARAWPLPGSASSMTPLADLFGTITPNGLVYERHHGGAPDIDPDQHRLVLHGLVRQPKLFTMDDLVRLPSESRIHFLECSGNTGGEWNGPSGQQGNRTKNCLHTMGYEGGL